MSSVCSLPSPLVYSIDVPEVKNFESKFFYNFHVIDEINNDNGQEVKSSIHTKIPRYVKLTFSPPYNEDVTFGTIDTNINADDLVYEDTFATDNYTTVNITNLSIEQQTTSNVKYQNNSFKNIIDTIGLNFDDYKFSSEYSSNASAKLLQENGISFTNDLVKNSKFFNLTKLRFDIQLNNQVVYDFFVYASGSYLSNNEIYKSNINVAKQKSSQNPSDMNDAQYTPSIQTYQEGIETGGSPATSTKILVGFLIQKFELRTDGTIREFDKIFLKSHDIISYIDDKVRYGAIYVYKIRALFKIGYSAVDNDTLTFHYITSMIASKPTVSYVETTENIAPPAPIEVRFVWDYDRINLNTSEFLPNTNIHLENVGKRGSLMIYWSFPINPQRDIKKFQVFRRKSIDEPFELIKMFDFDDSFVKFQNKEEFINQDLIESQTIGTLNGSVIAVPVLSYYDDDFYKNSEYIYSVASIDAHGLTSNYSEQIRVRFDQFLNKIETSLVSIAGAPKQFPNLYLDQDLFLDTIKTSYKKSFDVYFTPDCFSVTLGNNNKTKIIDVEAANKYVFNFINIDKSLGSNLKISYLTLQS